MDQERARQALELQDPALTESTSTFVALQHPVGLPFFGLGIAALFFYRSRLQARPPASPPAGDPDHGG